MRKRRKIKFSLPAMVAVFAIIAIIAGIISNVSADEEKKPYTSYRDSVLGIPGDFAVFTLEDASVTEVTADIAVGGDFLSGSFGNYNTWWEYFYKAHDLRHVNLNSYVRGKFLSNVGYNWTASYTKDELTTQNGTIKGTYDVGNANGKANLYLNTSNNTFDDSISENQTKINDTMYDNRNRAEGDLTYKAYNVVGVDYEFIDFEKEFQNLQTASTRLWNLSNQEDVDCIPTDGTQTYTYNFPSDKDVVVIKVDSENFYKHDQMNTFNIANFDESKKLVINIDSKDYIDKKTPKITVNGQAIDCDILAEDILFNFYSSEVKTEDSLETNEIVGTILAPNLNIRVNGNLDGAVIARKVTAQQAIYGINLNISWADLEEEPKIQIPVTKEWNDHDNDENMRPSSIEIEVYRTDTSATVDTVTLTKVDGWVGSSKELPESENGNKITYSVREKGSLNGYTVESITGDQTNGFIITNKHETTIQIPVTKVWDDNNNSDGLRPASVTIGVYNGSTEVDRITLSANESWTGKSKELPKYDGDTEINYTVKEVTTVGSYVASDPTGDKTSGFTITNSHTPGTITVKVTKDWQDSNNKDNLRPESIKVNVKKGNDVVDTITLTEENNWIGTSKSLPQIEGGTEIQYSVEEQDVPNGYQMQGIKGDYKEGYTITNYHKPNDPLPKYVDFSVTKKWEDSDNAEGDRPDSVTIRVYKNGEEVATKDLKEDDGWAASFRFAEGESDDIYTVKEDQVNKYQAKVEGDAKTGFTITNTYIEQVKTGLINVNINKFEENTTTSLEGAKFKATIVDSEGKEVYSKEVTTDKNGNISLANIELDLDKDYTLTVEETEAPSGYNKSEDKVKVSVKLTKGENGIEVEANSENKNVSINGNEITVKFEDEKIKENPPKEEPPKEEPAKEEPPVTVQEKEEPKSPTILPQTGSNTGVIIAIVVALTIVSRIIYVRFKKNNYKDK